MIPYDKAKRAIVIIFLTALGTALIQGCSVKEIDNSTSNQPTEVEFEKLKVEIDNDNHSLYSKVMNSIKR